MLHLGCMDYSKLTFPMPMSGGGILSCHLFAKVAHGMYDSTKSSPSTAGDLSSTKACPDHSSEAINEAKVISSSEREYDYIAEWVYNRSDEIGLQLDFIGGITEIVDQLRNVDRRLRTDTFRAELGIFEQKLAAYSDWFGYDPTGAAAEPRYKIVKFVLEDCRVFRTKARAPSLVACIVRRDDGDREWLMNSMPNNKRSVVRSHRSGSDDIDPRPSVGAERAGLPDSGEEFRPSTGWKYDWVYSLIY